MIKTTRYCDICNKEISGQLFYQFQLPEIDRYGKIILSSTEKDVCQNCFKAIYWKLGEIEQLNKEIN